MKKPASIGALGQHLRQLYKAWDWSQLALADAAGYYQEDDLPHENGPDGAHAGRTDVPGRRNRNFAGGTSNVYGHYFLA
jgi:hypothetical protein